MQRIALHDRHEIAAFLRSDPVLHLYEIGDLDPFFWPHTVWFGLRDREQLRAIALLWVGQDMPTLLGYHREPDSLRGLLSLLAPILPSHFYAHLTEGVADALESRFSGRLHGHYRRMVLRDRSALPSQRYPLVRTLTRDDLPAVLDLYQRAYPSNWFDARMLDTGMYRGWFEDDALIGVAGVHVYAPEQGVAALGNIAVDPNLRGRGLATQLTGALCRELLQTVDDIGLNVHADNAAAIACYRKLGFELAARYDEFEFRARPADGATS